MTKEHSSLALERTQEKKTNLSPTLIFKSSYEIMTVREKDTGRKLQEKKKLKYASHFKVNHKLVFNWKYDCG
jgi:hypothetical protein